MNKVEEFEKRVRLTDEDWESVNKKCGFDVMDIIINLDNRYTKNEQMEMIAKRSDETAQAQLNKVLNDPDLALINRKKKEPENPFNYEDECREFMAYSKARQDRHKAGFTHSITPLAEALKEK